MKKYTLILILLLISLFSCTKNDNNEQDEKPSIPEEKEEEEEIKEEINYPYTNEEYQNMTDDDYIENFYPVLRFTIASDLHIHDSDSEGSSYYKKVVKLCTMSYQEAEKESNLYKKLDAMLIAGDMVDNGKVTQYKKVKNIFDTYLKGETKLITTTGNHDYWNDKENTIATYLSVFTDQEEDQMVNINGFYFISMCASENGETAHFDDHKIIWLEKQLRTASKKAPGMPIFVMTHYAQFNTVYGSYDTNFGTSDLEETLASYPQVVYITGHSHFPIADPRSLYQENYTAINTGTTSYSCHSINGLNLKFQSVYPSDHYGSYVKKCPWFGDPYEIADMQIIEVNKFGSVLIKGYDMTSETQIFTRLVRYPSDKSTFKTNEMKKEESVSPEFDTSAELYFHEITNCGFTVHIPASISTEYVESYRAEIYDNNNNLINTFYLLGDEFLIPNPDTYILKTTDLNADTDYTLKVYAVNAYSKESTKPLVKSFHTKS